MRKGRIWLERAKNVLILLLACSAVYLTLRSQWLVNAGRGEGGVLGHIQALLQGEAEEPDGVVVSSSAARPVRVAVNTGVVRYLYQYDTEAVDAVFEEVGSLLAEALAMAEEPRPGTEEEWQAALAAPGVYFDFLGEIPLSALSSWLNQTGGNSALSHSARRLALAWVDGQVELWYWQEKEGAPWHCPLSDALRGQLEQVLVNSEGQSSVTGFFAFEREGYDQLLPGQLLTGGQEQAARTVYQASNPLRSEAVLDELVRTLGFNPHGLYESGDGQVVKDGEDTLRISDDGWVTYTEGSGAGSPRLPVETAGDRAAPEEALEAARKLVEQTLGEVESAARLYLISCGEQPDGSVEVLFGYLLEGAEVSLADTGYCARFLVQGRRISRLELCCRSYAATEETSPLMPERQALAALSALADQRGELLLCWPDSGGDTVRAAWGTKLAEAR